MEQYSDVASNPKKSLTPIICSVLCSGILTVFFAVYWLGNPDVYPSEFFGIKNPLTGDNVPAAYKDVKFGFECYTKADGATFETWLDEGLVKTNFFIRAYNSND